MIPGGLVARYGLRACPRHCAGLCKDARGKADGSIVASLKCELMTGPRPEPGSMPLLEHHAVDQLRAMAATGWHTDQDVRAAAWAELRRRGLA